MNKDRQGSLENFFDVFELDVLFRLLLRSTRLVSFPCFMIGFNLMHELSQVPGHAHPASADLSRPSSFGISGLGDLHHPGKTENDLLEVIPCCFHDDPCAAVIASASRDMVDGRDAGSHSAPEPGRVQGNGVQDAKTRVEGEDHIIDIPVTFSARVGMDVHKSGQKPVPGGIDYRVSSRNRYIFPDFFDLSVSHQNNAVPDDALGDGQDFAGFDRVRGPVLLSAGCQKGQTEETGRP